MVTRFSDLCTWDKSHYAPATVYCTLQASPNRHNDSVPYRILGNTTVAQNGTAAFTGLVVNGKPGDTVTLVFRTQVDGMRLLGTDKAHKCFKSVPHLQYVPCNSLVPAVCGM